MTDALLQFPDIFKALLEPWIEFREPTLHGVSLDPVVNFSADIPKREAVVEAFKVSANISNAFVRVLKDTAACLVGVWYAA